MPKDIKVATWNIAGGRQIKSLDLFDYEPENIEYFSSKLKEIDPDFVCIQEDHICRGKSVAQQIADRIGLKVCCAVSMSPSHIDKDCLLGMSILSRNSVDRCESVQLPYPGFRLLWKNRKEAEKHNKYLQVVKVGELSVVNFFAPPIQIWGYDYDRDQGLDYALTLEGVLLKFKKPLIVCGDFNYNEPGKIYPIFFDKYKLSDALPKEVTRPTANNHFENHDHIFYSDEFRCSDAKIVKTKTDHYLCVAELGPA